MGGKTTTSTNTVTIPKEVMDRYNAINSRAEGISNNPFQKYGTQANDFVAQMNEQQKMGISGLNRIAESGPSYNTVEKYLNPYITNVADTTRKQMEQANEQAQSGALGNAAISGAFGGDRAGVAAANLANQQGLSMGSTMANIYSQGYDQATNANMNDLNRMAGLAGNQLAMGTQVQQTEQAGKDALINQFQQEQGYPFQVASWLANIALGTGAQSGSTTTSVQPGSFWSDRRLKHDIKEIGMSHDGMPIYTFKYKGDPQSQTHVGFMADEVEKKHPEAVGLDPSGYKTVNYDKATESMGGGVSPHHRGEAFAAGGIAGPYGSPVGSQPGASGYVPEGYLPIGDLMIADPNLMTQHQQGMTDMLSSAANAGKDLSQLNDSFGRNGKFYKIFDSKKAYGGGVSGYADGGSPDTFVVRTPVAPTVPFAGSREALTLAAAPRAFLEAINVLSGDKHGAEAEKPADEQLQRQTMYNTRNLNDFYKTNERMKQDIDKSLFGPIASAYGNAASGYSRFISDIYKKLGDEQTSRTFDDLANERADDARRYDIQGIWPNQPATPREIEDRKKLAPLTGYVSPVPRGYADGGLIPAPIIPQAVAPQQHAGYLDSILAKQEADKKQPTAPQSAGVAGGQQQSGLSNVTNAVGAIKSIASLFALSDRRAKHDIKEIGKTHNGLPIYTFKYKGDDTQQTHVGFMADEVERKHPEAVGQSHGYKTVDYSQAHKFANGGVAGGRHGYQTAGAVEDKPWWERAAEAIGNAGAAPMSGGTGLSGNLAHSADDIARQTEAKTPVPQSNRTWPEYLSSFDLGPRAAAASAMLGGDLASMGARALGLGAGLVGAPETGNALMQFGNRAFENAGHAQIDFLGSDKAREELHNRLAHVMPQSSAAPISDFRGPTPVAVAQQKAREAEALARSRALDAAAVGAGTNDTAATQTPMSLADVAGLRPDRTGAINLGLPPSAMSARPGDYQAKAMEQYLIPRPKLRPADLGTAPSPAVAATGVVAPPVIVGTTMTPAPADTPYDRERLAAAFRWQESGSPSGNYGAIGKPVKLADGSTDYAYGAYGVMGSNIPEWTKKILGKPMTPQEFLRDPQAQEDVAKAKLDEYYAKYGNLEDVASAWFSGKPMNDSVDPTSGKSVPSYVSDVMGKYYGGGEGAPANYNIGTSPTGDVSSTSPQGGVAGGSELTPRGNAPAGGVKPYEERNWLGKIMHNPDGSMNKDAMLSMMAGIGDMLSNPSPFLLPTIGAGMSGAANTYMAREGQRANIANALAEANRTNINAATDRIVEKGGITMIWLGGDKYIPLAEYLQNSELYSTGDPNLDANLKSQALEKSSELENTVFSTPQVSSAIKLENTSNLYDHTGTLAASQDAVQKYNDAAAGASASKTGLIEQAKAVSSLTDSGLSQNLRRTVLSTVNDLLRLSGNDEFTSDTPSAAEVMNKQSILRSAGLAALGGQEASSALETLMAAQPGEKLQPETNANIMANMMLLDHRKIQMNDFVKRYQQLPGNTYHTATGAETAFNQLYGTMYLAQQKGLESIILHGHEPSPSGETMMGIMTRTDLPNDVKNGLARAFLINQGLSADEIANMGDIASVLGG